MANPANPDTFDIWRSSRSRARVATPKSGDTGTFDVWRSSRQRVTVFAKAVAAGGGGAAVKFMHYRRMRT